MKYRKMETLTNCEDGLAQTLKTIRIKVLTKLLQKILMSEELKLTIVYFRLLWNG